MNNEHASKVPNRSATVLREVQCGEAMKHEITKQRIILLTRNEIAVYFANTTHAIALQQDNSPTATCILDSMKTRQSLWETLFVVLF